MICFLMALCLFPDRYKCLHSLSPPVASYKLLVSVCLFWKAHHRTSCGTSSKNNGFSLWKVLQYAMASRIKVNLLSRHSGQSKLYDELPVCAATDSMLCFFSSFSLRVFAIILFFDIIDATFCHSKGGESMYRRAFPVIDPIATGKNIVRLRQARGMTVKDLQQWFGFEEPRAIYKWQQGQTLPSVDNLIALSALLDVPVEDILVCHYPHSQLNSPISLGRQDHSCRPFFYFRLSGKRRHTSGTSAILQYVSGKFAASCLFVADKVRILHKELQRWSRPSHVSFHIMRRELGWLDDRITREHMDAERLSV